MAGVERLVDGDEEWGGHPAARLVSLPFGILISLTFLPIALTITTAALDDKNADELPKDSGSNLTFGGAAGRHRGSPTRTPARTCGP